RKIKEAILAFRIERALSKERILELYLNQIYLGEGAYGDYMADGLYKQHIYVHPSKQVIIVNLCNSENRLKSERVRWRHVFRQIVDQL
ncbi:MAG: transglycosylase domain-containing protein, partial [Flavobacteriales bacterium]